MKVIGNPSANNERLKELVRRVRIDDRYLKQPGEFRREILDALAADMTVLDCGRSSREYFEAIRGKVARLETLDINDYGDYPDILCDLCAGIDDADLMERYDAVVCLAVLEHCYEPFRAADNLMRMLKPGGVLFGYVPFMFRYHGSPDLEFQDFVRFSRDGLAYMFRDAASIELMPIRGRVSAAMNFLFHGWKRRIEKYRIDPLIDRFYPERVNRLQCSGYNFIVRK